MDKAGVPSDSSSLIYLAKAGGLAVARELLGPLLAPPSVWREVVERGEQRGSSDVGAIRSATESGVVRRVKLELSQARRAARLAREFGLGAGESEVLALGAGHRLVLLDEHPATRAARHLGILSIETVVLPGLCARAGILDQPKALALLDELARHTILPSEAWLRARDLIAETES